MLQKDAPGWLDALAREADSYLQSLLGVSLKVEPSRAAGRVPYHLSDQYAFLDASILDTPFVLMARKPRAETPANISRHWREARRAIDGDVVVLARAMSAFNRHRLLLQRTPFMVPGNQLFIPELALDLRETFRREREAVAGDRLTPAAQVVVLLVLQGHNFEGETPSHLARRLNYTAMSMGRVFDQLGTTDFARVHDMAKERRLSFSAHGRALWHAAEPLLASPVRKTRRFARPAGALPGLLAGETALAEYTSLSAPVAPTIAVAASDWRRVALLFDAGPPDPFIDDAVNVETWSYDPALLSRDKRVIDRLSLYLSMRGDFDERVAQAADAVLEEMVW